MTGPVVAPGEMTERLRIERMEQRELPGGVRQPGYTPIGPPVWAKMVPLTGGEREEGEQRQATVRYRIWIRNRRDLDPSMRLVWLTAGNQVLNIRELFDHGNRAMYRELVAEAGAAS